MTVRTCRRHQVASAFTPRSTLSFLPPRTIFYCAPGRTCRCSLNFTCQPPVSSLVSPRSSTREISSCGVLTLVIRSLASCISHREIIRHRTRNSGALASASCCCFCHALHNDKNMKARYKSRWSLLSMHTDVKLSMLKRRERVSPGIGARIKTQPDHREDRSKGWSTVFRRLHCHFVVPGRRAMDCDTPDTLGNSRFIETASNCQQRLKGWTDRAAAVVASPRGVVAGFATALARGPRQGDSTAGTV